MNNPPRLPDPDHANSVYAPPKADLYTAQDGQGAMFYVVSLRKFWVLLIATLGLYQLYWFYKHFASCRDATGEKLWPVPRALFSVFFAHNLFGKISEAAQPLLVGTTAKSLSGYATLYVVFVILSNAADRVLDKLGVGDIALLVIAFGALPVYGWAMAKAQKVANIASGDPDGQANSGFTAANIAWIVFGIVIWLLAIVGTVATVNPDMVGQAVNSL